MSSVRSAFQRAMPAKTPSNFSMADRSGSATTGSRPAVAVVDHALDDGVEQGRLRVEVVVEGAPRGVELVEDVLDAHLLVALRLDEALGGVDERVAADGVDCHG